MKTIPKKYDITQCALYKCSNKKRLEQFLCLEVGGLKHIQDVIAYHSFEIDKKNSSEKRKITAPNTTLKLVQARILSLIQKVNRPEWLISGEKGKCYIDNGKAHLLGNYVLTIDVKKFYDNCKRDPVYHFFLDELKTSPDVAKLLTDIVTYDGGIPTGCPTSQMIAYYAYKDMFAEINSVAQRFQCHFTLYVDDMTFSSIDPFIPKMLAHEVDRVLRKYGHKPKYKKINYYSKHDQKPITGTIVTPDHRLDVPNCLQKKVYDNFQKIKYHAEIPLRSTDEEKMLLTLKGQLQAAKNIDEKRFPEITRIINQIHEPVHPVAKIKKLKYSKKKKIRIIEKVNL